MKLNLSRRLLTLLACTGLLLTTACRSEVAEQPETTAPQLLAVAEAKTLPVAHQNLVILDVRTAQEFSEGHLNGARNLDVKAEGFEQGLQQLDKNTPYLVYCASGRRSQAATAQMRQAGFGKVYELNGGIQAWQGAGEPVTK